MQVDDLVTMLEKGIRETFQLTFRLNDDPGHDIEPESIKTVKIAETILEMTSNARVRLEQSTLIILGSALYPPNGPDWARCISRHGKVDIAILFEEQGFHWPVIVVEAKRYVSGFFSIEDDVIRCVEFLAAKNSNGTNSIGATAVTFFWREKRGITHDQQAAAADKSISKIKSKADAHASNCGIVHRFIQKQVWTSAFKDLESADQLDECGTPAYMETPPLTVYALCCVFYRNTNAQFLDKIQIVR